METVMTAMPKCIVHCAAYTNVGKAESEWEQCYRVNAVGTHNMVSVAKAIDAEFVYLSTDYVFDGQRGGYAPSDIPHPVNWYATTKLLGEVYAQGYKRHRIIRTSFKPSPWKHAKAVEDMWTSADYVDVIAPLIDRVIGGIVAGTDLRRIIHVGTERKTMLDLARRRTPTVEPITRAEISVRLPWDTSLKD
jgi:dTDP-4-dehydrorhamnose reductase